MSKAMEKEFNPKMIGIARELVGTHVRDRRVQLGWQQQRLADIAHLRKDEVNNVELGREYDINTLLIILGAMYGDLRLVWTNTDILSDTKKS